MKKIGKYSVGTGDRFGHQGFAQITAIIEAKQHGIDIDPVWNKSNREHTIIGTQPADLRSEADNAVKTAKFKGQYFVDADHINLDTVDRFIDCSDFFTIDVASAIGKKAEEYEIRQFIKSASKYIGDLQIPGIGKPFSITEDKLTQYAENYLFAAITALKIYSKIENALGAGNFITEVSMDEVPLPQTPEELFFILMMLGNKNIPVQTIAPKFSGRFNKGVDYVGDIDKFEEEFEADLMVIDYAVKEFGLPENLKMSIHSGSDKFAIYPIMGKLIRKHDKGIHLKTAGTTWLEEVIGLATAGGEALEFAKGIYCDAFDRIDELCAPYADVIDIDKSKLPSKSEVSTWDSKKFADTLTHNQNCKDYNSNVRQLIHVAFKVAALKMNDYYRLLEENEEYVHQCVFNNLYNRHICKIFDIK